MSDLEEQITAQEQVVDDWSSGRASWWNLHAQSESPNRHAESAQHDLAQLQIEIAKLNDLRSRRPDPLVTATLALVEQQRIANLIAGLSIADSQHAPFGGTSDRDFLISQIHEGLGLS